MVFTEGNSGVNIAISLHNRGSTKESNGRNPLVNLHPIGQGGHY